jgi:hypothetical protein
MLPLMPKFLPGSCLLMVLVYLLCATPAAAQEFTRNFKALNAAYVELGGNGDVYSFNYDRVVYQQKEFKAALRLGIGSNLFFLENETTTYPIVPVEATGMLGRYKKHFEFGLGYTRRFTDDPKLLQNLYFARIGLRYQDPHGGLLVRVGLTPFTSSEKSERTPGIAIVPRFGLSIGRSF